MDTLFVGFVRQTLVLLPLECSSSSSVDLFRAILFKTGLNPMGFANNNLALIGYYPHVGIRPGSGTGNPPQSCFEVESAGCSLIGLKHYGRSKLG